jgi:amino acid transporter
VQIAAFMAGDSAWVALFIAGLLALLAALCFSELNGLYPTAAAVRQYIKSAINEDSSLTIAFGYVVTVVAVIAADSYVVGSAISYFFDHMIYAVAGLCVIQLRRRQPDALRSFRIPFGWTIPVLSILIFSALGLAAGLTPTPVPLLTTVTIFAATLVYVRLYVPRLKAQAQDRLAATGRRRPERLKADATGIPSKHEADSTGRIVDATYEQSSYLPYE